MAPNRDQCENKPRFPCRVEGWLNVWEVDDYAHSNLFVDGRVPLPIWEPHFCVLLQDCHKLLHHRTEKLAEEAGGRNLPRLRLDGGKEEFDKRWGYEPLECIKENPMQQSHLGRLDMFSRSQTLDGRTSTPFNSPYEQSYGERRGSVPAVTSASDETMDTPSTPSRLASFFSRKVIKSNLKRTKSVTKLDRKRPVNNDLEGAPRLVSSLKRTMSLGRLTRRWTPKQRGLNDEVCSRDSHIQRPLYDHRALLNARMRTSRSHESLLMTHSAMHSIDVGAAEVEIKPLHSSILGQDNCFQVSTAHGTKYYSCRTPRERHKWIQCLRKSVNPNQEQTLRTENSLQLWVLEAKNVPSKKRYFCDICLDKTLYARTSTKQKNDMLFWGEQFDFSNVPTVEVITINLYKEPDKKKKKEKNTLIGYIHINVNEITNRQLVERWYPASSAVVGKAGKENKSDLPLMRVKARYQTINILPLDTYQHLSQYVQCEYSSLVDVLEPSISVKAKEEIATTLINIMQHLGLAKRFLSDIVMAEVHKLDNENLTFRGNSIATKAMEAYMKLIGEKYLQETLGDVVRTVLETTEDCEVDPSRVPNNSLLHKQQANLIMYCEMAWFKIINSHANFPSELRAVFASLCDRCKDCKRSDVSEHLISACIFLRFLCPAVLSPSLFNLTQEFPQDKAARNLTLMAKTLQNLANFTKFGGKEEYMRFMNDFVEREFDSMHSFIKNISTEEELRPGTQFDGHIDIGKQLSILHSLLLESMDKVNATSQAQLSQLRQILEEISEAQQHPEGTLPRRQAASPQIYDNVTPEPQQHNGDAVVQPRYTDANLSNTQDSCVYSTRSWSRQSSTNSDSRQSLASMVDSRQNSRVDSRHSSVSSDSRQNSLRSDSRQNSTVVDGVHQSSVHMNREQAMSTTDDYVMFTGAVSATQTKQRPSEDELNQSWNRIVSAATMVNGDYVDPLVTFVDEEGASHPDVDSISQLSTVASSGYHSFGYSHSNSPSDCSAVQPLSFSNPLFQHPETPQTASSNHQGVSRMLSNSSLSSEDGSLPSPTHKSSSRHAPGKQYHEHTQRKLHSPSSSSSDSIKDYFKSQSPTHSLGSVHSGHMVHSHSISGHGHLGSPIENRPLTINKLSKSAEFAQVPHHASSPLGMKRNLTDSTLAQYNGRSTLPQHTVRMGVRSVHRQMSETEKSKLQYEQELVVLRQQLAETQAMLQETQNRLLPQQTTAPAEPANAQDQEHIKGVINRLMNAEEDLRREREQLHTVVDHKQMVIVAQERRIQALDAANARLLSALTQLKDRCQTAPVCNGMLSPTKPKLALAENHQNGQFKSSSC